eukprot:CAMPEP_0182423596 /NCGR_PEP_ID=MMETSP1167-20130531/9645_1 /TAXON_ID=2988 /ORGANISM="Mallomonas Sp, Strain CCMP3275" /LENGTH=433 /DNA_ID=CAMNT_0024602719 /DNA_START=416 /DNA_END=1717 /DNA_ORIENTATION=+
MTEVVNTLVTNAFKYTEKGGRVVIGIEFCKVPRKLYPHNLGLLKLRITDSGKGIGKEAIPELFERTIRFKPGEEEEKQGSGLSLWIAYRIVKLHEHCHLDVESAGHGRGSEFVLTIPCEHMDEVTSSGGEVRQSPELYRNTQMPSTPATALSPQTTIQKFTGKFDEISIRSYDSSERASREERRRSSEKYKISNMSRLNSPSSSSDLTQLKNKDLLTHRSLSRQPIASSPSLTNLCREKSTTSIRGMTTRPSMENLKRSFSKSKICCEEVHAADVVYPADEDMNIRDNNTSTYSDIGLDIDKLQSPAVYSALVVDDAPMNRKMLVRVLTGRCAEIHQAEDGKIAIQLLQNSMNRGVPYDFVLMDYQMPNMDGASAVKEMRKMGYTEPVIGITGNAVTQDMDTYLKNGANAVLTKPLNVKHLEDCLAEHQIYLP